MKSAKRQIAENRAERVLAFKAKYPDGRFSLQKWYGFGLYWEPMAPFDGARRKGFGVRESCSPHGSLGGIETAEYKGSSFGTNRSYASPDKLLAAAKRAGASAKLIRAFESGYSAYAKTRKKP